MSRRIVESRGHRYQRRFELNEAKLDKESSFLVRESALRAMEIRSFEELKKKGAL